MLKKPLLTVFNIGQGDALQLTPENDCILGSPSLLIDTGPASNMLSSKLIPGKYRVLITHSHADHLGGLPRVLREQTVSELYIPYYLPEIISIFSYLRKHMTLRIKVPSWRRLRKLNVRLVAQGDSLCGHADILNPPRAPEDVFGALLINVGDAEDPEEISTPGDNSLSQLRAALERLESLGITLPRLKIENYTTPLLPADNTGAIDRQNIIEYQVLARRFVHAFFIALTRTLSGATIPNIDYYTSRFLKLTANQVSAVLRYHSPEGDFLFTGDADIRVFERLLREKVNISAKYLKVPHHGSRENLSPTILHAINPTHAFVSHGSKYGHPHAEIVDLLDLAGVKTFYTNAVFKGGVEIKPATTGTVLNGLIAFV